MSSLVAPSDVVTSRIARLRITCRCTQIVTDIENRLRESAAKAPQAAGAKPHLSHELAMSVRREPLLIMQ